MTPLSSSLLELDRAALALAAVLGRCNLGAQIREQVKAVRRAAADVRLADLAAHPDQVAPADAVREVVVCAMRAGLDFPDIAALVNRVREENPGGKP